METPNRSNPQLVRRLTKSRFKIGLDCPTKLYYAANSTYHNNRSDDSFMEALAAGGYQVGELAKCYYPGGIDIKSIDSAAAVLESKDLLKAESITLFEATVEHENLLVRIDILVKTGQHFDLIEVKAKSVNPIEPAFMQKNGKGPTSTWKPYLMDVAYQQHVLQRAYPDHTITCHLLLADKTTPAATDGLNSRFRIIQQGKSDQSVVVDQSISEADLATPILSTVNVDDAVDWINNEDEYDGRTFTDQIAFLDQLVQTGAREQGQLGKRCKSCEFTPTDIQRQSGLLSGYRECWTNVRQWNDQDFNRATVFDIWNLRSADKLMAEDKLELDSLNTDDIPLRSSDTPGLSTSERQWMQINKTRDSDPAPFLDHEGLLSEMQSWRYPLHLIDFETTAPALPFTRGLKPYETVAFQFSHHVLHENDQVEHRGEFLESTLGVFPSLPFLRALKEQLEGDDGTVFRFHNHENTVLVQLAKQLQSTNITNEKETAELVAFIQDLTHAKNLWTGKRDMVDLHQLNLRYFYHPLTGGSNSLKALLPAILHSSKFLQNKYSEPIYGSAQGITSLNFKDHRWVTQKSGEIVDPYALLPAVLDTSMKSLEGLVTESDRVADGGAAMTAYALLQHVDLTEKERTAVTKGLLRYCELDTLAMVMVIEAWRDMLKL